MQLVLRKSVQFLLLIATTWTFAQSPGPVCDHVSEAIEGNPELARLHASFDGRSERRILSEVHYYPKDPHLTVGMGHWTYGNLSGLFRRIKADPAAWTSMTQTWADAMSPTMWAQFTRDTGVAGTTDRSVSDGLTKLMCLEGDQLCIAGPFTSWTRNVGGDFNAPSHWFTAGWKASSRLPGVAKAQVQHWSATMVIPGSKLAAESGARTLGGAAALVSARSSATAISKTVASQVSASRLPVGEARGSDDESARLKEDRRSVLAWTSYNDVKHWQKRERSSRIWSTYFAGTWGKEPRTKDDVAKLRHNGCFMARGDIPEAFTLSNSGSCKGVAELPKPAACSE